MASREGSRKRLKLSPTESKPISSIMAPAIASASSARRNSDPEGASGHEQTLKALQTDVDAMRQIVTCKICHRLLYEPYSLACGHTYCYSCLSQWLVDGRKKTCPDCRAVVNQQPTPSYLIRELVLVFVSRNELLPDGETIEEHNNYVKEEAEVVAKDKANADPRTGGLFKGCFKRGLRGYIGPIHDAGDGVDRCPECHWELEDGYCGQCGVMVDPHEHLGFSDYDDESDLTDDDLDHELDAEDAAAVFGADGQDDYFDNQSIADDVAFIDGSPGPGPQSPHRFYNHRRRGQTSRANQGNQDRILIDISDESEAEDEDEDDGNLPDFVVDDDNVEYASSDEGEGTDVPNNPSNARRRGPIVVVSDDDDRPASASVEPTSGSEDDSEDEGPIVLGGHRRKRGPSAGRLQRGRRTISSDEESSEDEDDQSAIAENGGFSPLDSSAPDYPGSINSGYDSDGVSTVHPMDDEDGYDGHVYHDENNEEDDESDASESETGWGTHHETPANSRPPPSTSSHRLHHLGRHSSRHSDAFVRAATTNVPPSLNGHYHPHFSVREPYSTHATRREHPNRRQPASSSTYPSYGDVARSSRSYGMFGSRPELTGLSSHRPRPEFMGLPAHPFNLGSTLHDVSNRTNSLGRNYNQRNNQIRSNPAHRTVSATSSHSSATGGVDVHESNSSGSSSTLRGDSTSGRRKRNLSISSDDSLEEYRRSYAY